MNINLSDFALVIFTNEKYSNLLELTIPYINKAFKDIDIKKYVVSNKLTESIDVEGIDEFEKITSDVNFCEKGSHYSKTMKHLIENISEKYILFLCDDYLVKSEIKKDVFYGIISFIYENNIDYFYLGTQKHMEKYRNETSVIDTDYKSYNLPKGCLYNMDKDERHLYSVQPCFWNTESLLQILKNNENLSLHGMDNTEIKDKKGNKRVLDNTKNYMFYKHNDSYDYYNFKNVTYHHPILTYHVDEKPLNSDYLMIDYIEIVRHGKFINSEVNSKIIFNDILYSDEMKHKINKLKKFL